MVHPTLDELRQESLSLSAAYGQAKREDRGVFDEARRDELGRASLAAVVAFRAIKHIDSTNVVLTQAEADHICAVISTRIGVMK